MEENTVIYRIIREDDEFNYYFGTDPEVILHCAKV